MMIGKLIGAFFGFLFAKHIGLIFGVFIGHLFDKGLAINMQPFGANAETRAKIQTIFFKLTFLVMGHIAKADGRINESEIQMARNLMQELRLDEKQRQQAMKYFREGKSEEFHFRKALSELYQQCARHPHLLQLFLEIQLQAVYADGVCNPNERKLLEIICDELHISRFVLAQCEARLQAERAFREGFQFHSRERRWHERQRSHDHFQYGSQHSRTHQQDYGAGIDPLKEAYGVLGVTPQASLSDIKKAYRKLMSTHHPDKLVAQGLPEEMMKMATEKTQKIQKAYDLIIKARGQS